MIQWIKDLFTKRRYARNTYIQIGLDQDSEAQFTFNFDQSSFDELVFLFLKLSSGASIDVMYTQLREELTRRNMLHDYEKLLHITDDLLNQTDVSDDEIPIIAPSVVFKQQQQSHEQQGM